MKWITCNLGSVLTLKRGYDLPGSQRQPGDVPIISSAGLSGFHRVSIVDGPGVITGRYGTIGQVYFVREPFWPLNTALYVCDFKGNDPRFIAYFLQNALGNLVSDKAAVPGVDRNVLHARTVRFPRTKKIQERIAQLLSPYDDLIENNRRRMQLLEESARLLYQEWFVRLRFPGHEHVKVNDGVPAGWNREPLERVAEFRLGKMLDEKKNRGEPLPYLANVNVRWGTFDLHELREMRFEHDEIETYGLKFGDIVMCEGGEPGRCAIWRAQRPRMMIQKAIHRIRCRPGMSHEYLYHALRHQGNSGQLAAYFTGATIKHLPREKLAKVSVLVPRPELLEHFTEFARPIERQMGILEAANARAAEARDILLPRLMSGELAV